MALLNIFLHFLIFTVVIMLTKGELTEYEVLEHMFAEEPNVLLMRPPGINGSYSVPVRVDFSAYIYRVDKIDEINMELQLYLHYRMSWVDPRLSENYFNFGWSSESYLKHIIVPEQYKIWTPDMIFKFVTANEKCGERLPYSTTLIFPNGTVEYAKRLQIHQLLIVKCPMNLKKYPFDIQRCYLKIRTARTNKREVLLRWREYEPLTFATVLNSLHTVTGYHIHTDDYRTMTGQYSGISVSFYFARDFQYYFIKFYLPVLIVVLISWIPFRMNGTSVVRIGFALSTLLFSSWYYLTRPDQLLVPYATYLDVWRAVNFLFVFLAAMESFFVVHRLKYNTMKKYLDNKGEKTDQVDVEAAKVKSNFKIYFIGVPKGIEDLDCKCNSYFPLAYIVFILFYWLGFYVWD